MTPDDKKRFATLMNWLADKFPKKDQPRKLTTQDLQDYFDALKTERIENLEYAAKYHFANEEFFPRPCKLKEWAKLAPRPEVPKSHQLAYTPAPMAKERLRALVDAITSRPDVEVKP